MMFPYTLTSKMISAFVCELSVCEQPVYFKKPPKNNAIQEAWHNLVKFVEIVYERWWDNRKMVVLETIAKRCESFI